MRLLEELNQGGLSSDSAMVGIIQFLYVILFFHLHFSADRTSATPGIWAKCLTFMSIDISYFAWGINPFFHFILSAATSKNLQIK